MILEDLLAIILTFGGFFIGFLILGAVMVFAIYYLFEKDKPEESKSVDSFTFDRQKEIK